ncbi:hypothetical protein ElyMa_000878700 [Elysia marginata]|uniref:Uncharacterized protein n=1 Tax=Elysia marginata TaxID=1093978 RepID=A0AAV4H759_9GAST|nr:hypothetical protein ElyMa_000878700 [Elysia marginata]
MKDRQRDTELSPFTIYHKIRRKRKPKSHAYHHSITEAFPPLEDKKMLWLQDGNANTCNDGTVTPPVVIVPFFKTAVTYMRITLQQPGAQVSGLEFAMV